MKRWMTWWSSDRIAILVGFALTIVSLIGGQAYVEPAIQAATAIDQEIAAKRARMMIIDDAVALDDLAKQLGGAVFIAQPRSTDGVVAVETHQELKKRSLLHRHDGVRATIAGLGIAGEIDFPSASRAYEALVEAENRNFTFETYQAANDFDADMTTKAVKAHSSDRMRVLALQRMRAPAIAESDWRGLSILIVSSFGSLLILIATLKASNRSPPVPPRAPVDPRQAAIALLTAALAEARARIAATPSRPA
jgi:hypothetical protein